MGDYESSEVPVAEAAAEDVSAMVGDMVIGEVDGLVWEDTSGVDIVSIRIHGDQVAVPVDHAEWRGGGVVAIEFDMDQVMRAPALDLLRQLRPSEVIERVAEHYSVNLGGPPPGPDPQPLPPWWDPEGDQ